MGMTVYLISAPYVSEYAFNVFPFVLFLLQFQRAFRSPIKRIFILLTEFFNGPQNSRTAQDTIIVWYFYFMDFKGGVRVAYHSMWYV